MIKQLRISKVILAFLLVLLTLTSCTKPDSATQGNSAVRVGAILPLTGPTSYLGEDERLGIELALASRQNSNPKIEFIFEDSQGKSDLALSAMRKLIDVNKTSIFVVTTTTPVLATLPAFQESGKDVLVFSQAMIPEVTKGYPFAFRVYATSDEETDLTSAYAKEKGYKRFAALHIANRFGEEGINYFSRKVKSNGGEVVINESFQFTDTDYRTVLTKIKQLNPDAIAIYAYSTNYPLIFRQMEEIGLNIPVLGNADLALGGLQDKISSSFLERVVFPAPYYYVSQNDAQVLDFNQKVRAKGKAPNFDIGYSYDSTMILIRAIEQTNSSDPSVLKQYLLKMEPYKGVTGTIKLNEERDTRADMQLVRWGQNGVEVVWQRPQ